MNPPKEGLSGLLQREYQRLSLQSPVRSRIVFTPFILLHYENMSPSVMSKINVIFCLGQRYRKEKLSDKKEGI